MRTFLESEEIAILTGRKVKSKQIIALRTMGIPFFINALGQPIVTYSSIEGKIEVQKKESWVPNFLGK